MSFETLLAPESQEPELVNQGVRFITQKVRAIAADAEISISDYVTYPPRLLDNEDRLGKEITIDLGMHKIVLFAYEAIDHSRRRAALGEEHPLRNIMGEVMEFSGPTIDNDAYYMNCGGGRKLTVDDTQGVGLSFIACSYDYKQKTMIDATGIDDITWRLEREFVPFLKAVLSHAQEKGCMGPMPNQQPVRTPHTIYAKAFGLP